MYARLRQMFSLAVLAAALCGSPAQAQTPTPTPAPEAKPDYTITGNFGIYSQYIFRGLTQTDQKPAVQGGFDYAHTNGIYLGTWASNISWLHVDLHLAVLFKRRLDDSTESFDANLPLGRQSLIANEMDEAASAVAALLDLAAVSVEDPVAEIDVGARWPLDQQDLVAADAEMTIGKAHDLGAVEVDALANAVEHHKIVAQSLHLGELETHIRIIAGDSPAAPACSRGQREHGSKR